MKKKLFFCVPVLGMVLCAAAYAQTVVATTPAVAGCAYYRTRVDTLAPPAKFKPDMRSARVSRSDEDLVIPAADPDGWIVNACRGPATGAL
jgi:hypothetical protein